MSSVATAEITPMMITVASSCVGKAIYSPVSLRPAKPENKASSRATMVASLIKAPYVDACHPRSWIAVSLISAVGDIPMMVLTKDSLSLFNTTYHEWGTSSCLGEPIGVDTVICFQSG